MIRVKEAERLILKNQVNLPATFVKTEEAYYSVLCENIYADRPQPPFDRVAMDGIAVNFAACQEGLKTFLTEGVQGAGTEALSVSSSGNCIEVMTGGVLPAGTDCVIKVEDIDFFTEGKIRFAVLKEGVRPEFFQNIHKMGSDYRQGDLLLAEGTLMLAPQVAVAVSNGKAQVRVTAKHRISLISTGDELVGIQDEIKPYQIRMSNTYAMYSALRSLGYTETRLLHFKDDRKLLLKKLGEIIHESELVILSGGVSMGKFDFIPAVLKELGVKEVFHKVSQKPGKPFWFGVQENSGKPVFGLPGNPVSSTICFYRYVIPYLWKLAGINPDPALPVKLAENIKLKEGMTFFVPVRLERESELKASIIKNNGSGDFASLTASDGFIEVEASNSEKGNIVRFYSWRL